MAGIFKAYDVRGLYPEEINEEIAGKIGLAFRGVLDEAALGRSNQVIVSRDMRTHSEPLAASLIDGLRDTGLDVVDIGLATTPMNYFAVGHLGAAGGVQVTASHNPARYNGFKFSRDGARPVSGDHGIPLIESRVQSGELERSDRRGGIEHREILSAYGEHVLSFLEKPVDGPELTLAVDAANGMGSLYQPLLERLGARILPLYFELLKLENLRDLSQLVQREGADLGICFDGDADRAAFTDESGEAIGSDLMTALVAGELLVNHPDRHVVYDLRSSRAVAEYIREKGGIPVRERVGHSFIKATLRRHDGIFGGELAGHYYFRDNYFADSALLAVVQVVNLVRKRRQPLSEIVAPLRRYAKSPEINFEVEDKQGKIDELAERFADGEVDFLDGITVAYDDWWFNVRPSNTEPYLRLVLEARTLKLMQEKKEVLLGILGTPEA